MSPEQHADLLKQLDQLITTLTCLRQTYQLPVFPKADIIGLEASLISNHLNQCAMVVITHTHGVLSDKNHKTNHKQAINSNNIFVVNLKAVLQNYDFSSKNDENFDWLLKEYVALATNTTEALNLKLKELNSPPQDQQASEQLSKRLSVLTQRLSAPINPDSNLNPASATASAPPQNNRNNSSPLTNVSAPDEPKQYSQEKPVKRRKKKEKNKVDTPEYIIVYEDYSSDNESSKNPADIESGSDDDDDYGDNAPWYDAIKKSGTASASVPTDTASSPIPQQFFSSTTTSTNPDAKVSQTISFGMQLKIDEDKNSQRDTNSCSSQKNPADIESGSDDDDDYGDNAPWYDAIKKSGTASASVPTGTASSSMSQQFFSPTTPSTNPKSHFSRHSIKLDDKQPNTTNPAAKDSQTISFGMQLKTWWDTTSERATQTKRTSVTELDTLVDTAAENNSDENLKNLLAKTNAWLTKQEKKILTQSSYFSAVAKLHLRLETHFYSENKECQSLLASIAKKITTFTKNYNGKTSTGISKFQEIIQAAKAQPQKNIDNIPLFYLTVFRSFQEEAAARLNDILSKINRPPETQKLYELIDSAKINDPASLQTLLGSLVEFNKPKHVDTPAPK